MEEHLLKTVAGFSLLALVVWVVASALGKRDQVQPSRSPYAHEKRVGGRWSISPCLAEMAQPVAQMAGPVGPMTRY